MTDYEKQIQNFENLLSKLQGSTMFSFEKEYNKLYYQLATIINALEISDVKLLKNAILSIEREFNTKLRTITYSNITNSQNLAYKKSIYELESILMQVGLETQLLNQTLNLYSNKVKNRINKQYISNRIWNINKVFFDEIKSEIDKALLTGLSNEKLARKLKRMIKSSLPQGRGIYNSALKNATRLSRTEIKRAFQFQEHSQIIQIPFVKGIKVNLSASHPTYDMCDELKGIYPPDFIFGGWHPNCLCYTTVVKANNAKIKDIIKNGGQVEPIEMPKNYYTYLDKHKKRFAKKPPLFVTENSKFNK